MLPASRESSRRPAAATTDVSHRWPRTAAAATSASSASATTASTSAVGDTRPGNQTGERDDARESGPVDRVHGNLSFIVGGVIYRLPVVAVTR
ncbi:MAG TPA: hypothetical protein VGH74_14910 [Planctomycetaceae bacterium]|jgi:hypothetical protein